MSKMILITGGAGFIGSHLTDTLLLKGYNVRIVDNLSPQVHGIDASKPVYMNKDVQFIRGNICDSTVIKNSLKGVDVVFHLAASVGVGQSMYQIRKYTETNNTGTATLLEHIHEYSVERLIITSSMSVYGEGLYRTQCGDTFPNAYRTLENLQKGKWEPTTPDGEQLIPIPTPESKQPSLSSIYALSKFDQEKMCQIVGNAYKIPTIALRLFNVYGKRQALSNPYTGVLAIFASRYMNNKSPVLFEDGLQMRDFVSVHDVCKACVLALEKENIAGMTFNIASGESLTLREVTTIMSQTLEKPSIEPQICGKYRFGDIRHCFADISLARKMLGYNPEISLKSGLIELSEWLESQTALDRFDTATAELVERGLAI